MVGWAAALAGLVLLALLAMRSSGPEVRGHPIRTWLRMIGTARDAEAAAALREAGTNALPAMVALVGQRGPPWTNWRPPGRIARWLRLGQRKPDPRHQAVQAFRLLGASAVPAIPDLERLLQSGSNPGFVASALVGIGPEAVMSLARALGHSDFAVRFSAASALRQAGLGAEPAIPSLIGCMAAPDLLLRVQAAATLAALGLAPEKTVPALAGMLGDTNSWARLTAVQGLAAFGIQATQALPRLRTLTNDPDTQVRQAAALTVLQIEANRQ